MQEEYGLGCGVLVFGVKDAVRKREPYVRLQMGGDDDDYDYETKKERRQKKNGRNDEDRSGFMEFRSKGVSIYLRQRKVPVGGRSLL